MKWKFKWFLFGCVQRKKAVLSEICYFVVMAQHCDSVGLSSYSHVGHQVNPQSVAFYGSVDCSEADSINLMWALCCKLPTHPSFSTMWLHYLCCSAHSLVIVLFLSLASTKTPSQFFSIDQFLFTFSLLCLFSWFPTPKVMCWLLPKSSFIRWN